MRLHQISTIFTILFAINGCGVLKEQGAYLQNLSKPNQSQNIQLLENTEFKQIRGKIKTHYYAFIEKGDYKKIIEGENGSFFYNPKLRIICEDREFGGLFLTKEQTPRLFLWTALITDKNAFAFLLNNPEYIKDLGSLTNPERLFVHTTYEIKSVNYFIK